MFQRKLSFQIENIILCFWVLLWRHQLLLLGVVYSHGLHLNVLASKFPQLELFTGGISFPKMSNRFFRSSWYALYCFSFAKASFSSNRESPSRTTVCAGKINVCFISCHKWNNIPYDIRIGAIHSCILTWKVSHDI